MPDPIIEHLLERALGRINGLKDNGKLKPLVCIQGGGAKGAWQGGVLEALLKCDNVIPVASFGSSAGAINSLFIADKLQHKETEVFKNYWTKFKKLNLFIIFIAILLNLPVFIFLFLKSIILEESRYPGIVPFWIFKRLLSRKLSNTEKSEIYLYMYATNIDAIDPPTYNSQIPYTFSVRKNDNKAMINNKTMDIKTAISISCCLPFVHPVKLGKSYFADGGIYSNLPIDTIVTNGASGGNSIIILLSKPIRDFKPHDDDIDYKSLMLLHKVHDMQRIHIKKIIEGLEKGEKIFSGPALMYSPILVVEPKERLFSGIVLGFISPQKMFKDYELGVNDGAKFKNDINRFLSREREALNPYLLINLELPPLPTSRPFQKKIWMHWVNKKWRQPDNFKNT